MTHQEMELRSENQALQRQVRDNYGFMEHQQRRIASLESQLNNGGRNPGSSNYRSPGTGATGFGPSSSGGNYILPGTPVTSGNYNHASTAVQPGWRSPTLNNTTNNSANNTAITGSLHHRPSTAGSGTVGSGTMGSPALGSGSAGPGTVPASPAAGSNPTSPVITSPNTPPASTPPTNLFNNNNLRETQPTGPAKPVIRFADAVEVQKISIDPAQIGPLQFDFDVDKLGFRFILNCKTAQNEDVTAIGKLSVVILDPKAQGEQARVGRCDLTPEQVASCIANAPQPDGILFELAVPRNKEVSSELDVFCRLEDRTGRKIETQQKLNLAGPRFAVWKSNDPQSAQPLSVPMAGPENDGTDNNITTAGNPGIAGPGIAGPGMAGPGMAGPGIAGPEDNFSGQEIAKSEIVVAAPRVEARVIPASPVGNRADSAFVETASDLTDDVLKTPAIGSRSRPNNTQIARNTSSSNNNSRNKSSMGLPVLNRSDMQSNHGTPIDTSKKIQWSPYR